MSKRYALALIPCSKRKNPIGITPITLYGSSSFSVMLRHAQQRCDRVLIMSAKYGLLELHERMAYYEAYLPDLNLEQRAELAKEMRAKVLAFGILDVDPVQVLSYLPKAYFDFLASIDIAAAWACQINRPYKNLPLLRGMKVLTDEIRDFPTNPTTRGPELSGLPRIRISPDAYEP